MLKSVAQAAPVHTYIAEATYNENCYVDANHVVHCNLATYQATQSPQMSLERPISVVAGDALHFTGSQSYRNFINMSFYRNGTLVYHWIGIFQNITSINVSATAPFTGEFDAIAVSFGGGGSEMTALDIKATKNGEVWLN